MEELLASSGDRYLIAVFDGRGEGGEGRREGGKGRREGGRKKGKKGE